MKFAVVLNKDSKFIERVLQTLDELHDEFEFVRLDEADIYPEFVKLSSEPVNFLLVFGGDGTILYASQLALQYNLPVLGINVGTLGFLSEIVLEDLKSALLSLMNGEFTLQQRMLLEVKVLRNSECIGVKHVLNDAVIYRAHNAKLIEVEVYNNEDFVYKARADGILISTPTGSTGYNLSTGGPILNPTMDSVVVNAINPHLLTVRPMVFYAGDVFEFRVRDVGKESTLQLDGMNFLYLQDGDRVVLTKSTEKIEFVKLGEVTFFQTMQRKFHMGEQLQL